MNMEERLNQCQKRMSNKGAGLMILFPSSNLRYMTGIEKKPGDRQFMFVIPSFGEPHLVAPELERDQINSFDHDVSFYSDSDSFTEFFGSFLGEIGVPEGKVLLDDQMWEKFSQDIRSVMPEKEYGLASEVLRDVRMVKSEDEIEKIRLASEIIDNVVEDVREMNPVGMTEKQLVEVIDERMNEYGGEGRSFDTIVAAGEHGAKPHHIPTDRKIDSGEMVVLDFGTWVDDYASDQTRTLVFGDEHPSRKAHRVHDIVRTAQEEAVKSVEPGIRAGSIDKIARSVIDEAGYGKNFVHRTGHGIGLEVHEHPEIREDGEEILKPGMVFSVEPGIYIENEFGVRIEDLVLVTKDGYERLNRTSRDCR
jgi:Xaa-Pro aminopeptidase